MNLKIKVITATNNDSFEHQLNEFVKENVNIVATQTHTNVIGSNPAVIKYVGVVYYKELGLPKL